MPVQIPLTRGFFAIVDCEDAALALKYSWQAFPGHRTMYAKRSLSKVDGGASILMHRDIIGPLPPGSLPDHRDGNGLNNQRGNLRIVTKPQNSWNTVKPCRGTSQYKGVNLYKKTAQKKWGARVVVSRAPTFLGLFYTEEAAAIAYDAAIRETRGPHATFNFPRPGERSALTGQIIPLIGASA